jgi:homopolymeric O-antigen transport system ATP-binding protein
MSDLAVSVQNLSKAYLVTSNRSRATTLGEAFGRFFRDGFKRSHRKEFWALSDVSFDVRQGEVFGIIGRNGAGKTTLLKVLSRITEPTRGQVDLYGRVGSLLEVGTGFHPELTGRENIYLNGAILGMSRSEINREFDSIVAFAETEAFLDTPVKRYSSGMYVRLAFAVAAHLNPEILIVDEVLAVGDVQFQRKSMARMESAATEEGKTVLFVSHNMAAIAKLCNRVVLLEQGKVQAIGTPQSVVTQYFQTTGKRAAVLADRLPEPLKQVAITTFNSQNQETAVLRLREPWRVRLEFELSRGIDHCIAAIGLRTLDTIPIVTFWTQSADISAGKYVAEFPCDLPISAGEVAIAVGFSSFGRTLYYEENASSFSISDIAEGEEPFRTSGAGFITGRVRPEIRKM